MISLGATIKAHRKRHRSTIQQLAQAINYSTGYVSEVEQDKVTNPSLAFLGRVAEHFGIDAGELISLLPTSEESEEGDTDHRISVFLRGANERDLQFVDAQLRILRAYESGNDLTKEAKSLFSRITSKSSRGSRADRPEHIVSIYLQLARLYVALGCETRSQDANEYIVSLRQREAIECFVLAEDICIRYEDEQHPAARGMLVEVWYRLARAYQDLASLDMFDPAERRHYSSDALSYCNKLDESVEEKCNVKGWDALIDEEKALWPAVLAVSAHSYQKLMADAQASDGLPNQIRTSPSATAEYIDSLKLQERRASLAARGRVWNDIIVRRRERAQKLYLDWISELKSRRKGSGHDPEGQPATEDRLATAYFHLAMLSEAIEVHEARRKTLDPQCRLITARRYFLEAISLRRQLARGEPSGGPHHRDLGRYHREFGLALQYSSEADLYGQMMWQHAVAREVFHGLRESPNRKMDHLQSIAEALNGGGDDQRLARAKIEAMLRRSDFDRLEYELVYLPDTTSEDDVGEGV